MLREAIYLGKIVQKQTCRISPTISICFGFEDMWCNRRANIAEDFISIVQFKCQFQTLPSSASEAAAAGGLLDRVGSDVG